MSPRTKSSESLLSATFDADAILRLYAGVSGKLLALPSPEQNVCPSSTPYIFPSLHSHKSEGLFQWFHLVASLQDGSQRSLPLGVHALEKSPPLEYGLDLVT